MKIAFSQFLRSPFAYFLSLKTHCLNLQQNEPKRIGYPTGIYKATKKVLAASDLLKKIIYTADFEALIVYQ